MRLEMSQRGPVGFGLPNIGEFKIGFCVRGWNVFGISNRSGLSV